MGDPQHMRRLLLTTDLTLDGFVGHDGGDPHWADGYYDEELIKYQLRVLQKAGVHALESDWTVEALEQLKTDGGDVDELAPILAQGGPEFCQELTRRALVDEYRVTVHPVVFGDGHRLFAAPDRLYLIGSRHFSKGSVAHTYVPERAYRDHPPPYPWSLSGSERPGQDEHDADPEDPAEGPAPA
jgi:riboflavin biosynthesis pyrimidine reductase